MSKYNTYKESLWDREDEFANSIYAQLDRLFTDFERDFDVDKKKKKNRKQLSNFVENFFDEIYSLLNLNKDEENSESKVPWPFIFYNRMKYSQTILSTDLYLWYLEIFEEYYQTHSENIKPKRKAGLANTKMIIEYLKSHEMDPDNALLGLPPNPQIHDRFDDWLRKPNDHSQRAEALSLSSIHNNNGVVDPRALYFFKYPAKRGDLVVAQVNDDVISSYDLRHKFKSSSSSSSSSYSSSSSQQQQGEGEGEGGEGGGGGVVVIIARIKDAVEFNRKLFLKLTISPKEDTEFSIQSTFCFPLETLMPHTTWAGNLKKMKEMVEDPFNQFYSFLRSGILSILNRYLSPYDVDCRKLYDALQSQPVSFLHLHSLSHAQDKFDALFNPSSSTSPSSSSSSLSKSSEGSEKKGKKTGSTAEEIKQLVDQLPQIREDMDEFFKSETERFFQSIVNNNEVVNNIFMPTSKQNLIELKKVKIQALVNSILSDLSSKTRSALAAMEGEKREVMNGNLKNQISKWWLLLIKTQTEMLLSQVNYDFKAFDEDTYIDERPPSLDKIKENLLIIQDLLNPKHPLHHKVLFATEEVKKEVYPVIDDFILKSYVILYLEVLGEKLSLESTDNLIYQVPLDRVKKKLDNKIKRRKESNLKPSTRYIQLDDLIKDLQYIVEMKKLEMKTDGDREEGGAKKLELSKAVPLSGLVMGVFFRLENILKTVLELWDTKPKPSPLSSSPLSSTSSSSDPIVDNNNNNGGKEKGASTSTKSKIVQRAATLRGKADKTHSSASSLSSYGKDDSALPSRLNKSYSSGGFEPLITIKAVRDRPSLTKPSHGLPPLPSPPSNNNNNNYNNNNNF